MKSPVYTLEWVKKEAEGISGHWNGEDAQYIDHDGDVRTEDDAHAAQELLEKLAEVEALMEELGM
jgi:hypothetical protein